MKWEAEDVNITLIIIIVGTVILGGVFNAIMHDIELSDISSDILKATVASLITIIAFYYSSKINNKQNNNNQ